MDIYRDQIVSLVNSHLDCFQRSPDQIFITLKTLFQREIPALPPDRYIDAIIVVWEIINHSLIIKSVAPNEPPVRSYEFLEFLNNPNSEFPPKLLRNVKITYRLDRIYVNNSDFYRLYRNWCRHFEYPVDKSQVPIWHTYLKNDGKPFGIFLPEHPALIKYLSNY